MSRIYTSVVTIDGVNVYGGLTSDPNGSLSAPMGSLAMRTDVAVTYRNTDGGTTWQAQGVGMSLVATQTETIIPGDNALSDNNGLFASETTSFLTVPWTGNWLFQVRGSASHDVAPTGTQTAQTLFIQPTVAGAGLPVFSSNSSGPIAAPFSAAHLLALNEGDQVSAFWGYGSNQAGTTATAVSGGRVLTLTPSS